MNLESQLAPHLNKSSALQAGSTPVQGHAAHNGAGETISIWQKLVAKSRIDLSNLAELKEWSQEMLSRGEKWLVIDLKGTRFMGLPVIRYFEDLSEELRRAGGALAFEAMPDKTRRIFEIYGSLQNIVVVERAEQLRLARERISHPFSRLKSF